MLMAKNQQPDESSTNKTKTQNRKTKTQPLTVRTPASRRLCPVHVNRISISKLRILFIDVVGYSKLLADEQSETLQLLNQIVRGTADFRSAEEKRELIRLPTGDGMALVFLTKPEAPVRCALEISKAIKRYPELQLRMGIHSGSVNQVSDVNDRLNVTGAGINMAQRAMDCGDAGHILLSQRVAGDLAQYRLWRPRLHDFGECEVKHGVRVQIFILYTDEIGNRNVPSKLKPIPQEPAPSVIS